MEGRDWLVWSSTVVRFQVRVRRRGYGFNECDGTGRASLANAMGSTVSSIPLFPLPTVLFPGGVLPLRIFEPRYTDMISRCLRETTNFGVVLVRVGVPIKHEADARVPRTFEIGTEAQIIDFNQADSNTLGIVVKGQRKFRIHQQTEQKDRLLIGQVEYLPEESAGKLLPEHAHLVDVLTDLATHPLVQKLNLDLAYDEARSVSHRLAELLPIEPEIKQALLQMRTPRERLMELARIVRKFQE